MVVTCFPQDFTERILGIGRRRFHFRIAFQGGNSFDGIGITRIKVQIAETVEGRGEIRIDLQSCFQQGSRAIIILLKEEPLPGQVQDVLIAGITFQQVVHAGDGGKNVVVLDRSHPADQELFVGSRAGKKGLGLGEGGSIRHAAASREGNQGIAQG